MLNSTNWIVFVTIYSVAATPSGASALKTLPDIVCHSLKDKEL